MQQCRLAHESFSEPVDTNTTFAHLFLESDPGINLPVYSRHSQIVDMKVANEKKNILLSVHNDKAASRLDWDSGSSTQECLKGVVAVGSSKQTVHGFEFCQC